MKFLTKQETFWAKDFAGDIMSKYKDVKLVNYGFKYKLDNNCPLDNVTWFLLEKKSNNLN